MLCVIALKPLELRWGPTDLVESPLLHNKNSIGLERTENRGRRVLKLKRGKMGVQVLGMNLTCLFDSLYNLNLPQKDCVLPLISKALGYAIILGSVFVKFPQIYLILKNRSIKGLSAASFELEVLGLTIALSYCVFKRLPFSTYGELLFLLIQALVIVILIYNLSSSLGAGTWLKTALYCGLAPTLLAGSLDPVVYEALYASQHVILCFSRIPQILKNFQNRSTGQLSFITNFLNFAGSAARLFTSIHEKLPVSMAVGSTLGVIFNGVLVSQILIYRNRISEKRNTE